jgi:hypothetical protein
MSIFDIEKNIKQEEFEQQMRDKAQAVDVIIGIYNIQFKNFFYNERLSAQEHCNFLGTNAKKVFEALKALENLILFLKPDWTPPTIPYEYTIHQDGTITIGNKIDD